MNRILKIGETFGNPLSVREVSGFVFQEVRFEVERIPLHTHEDTHISFVLEGHYRQYQNRRVCDVRPTTLSFHPYGERHSTLSSTISREFVMWLNQNTLRRISESAPILHDNRSFTKGAPVKTAVRLYKEFCNRDKTSELALEALALELLVDAEREENRKSSGAMPHWLKNVRDYLHENYREEFTVSELTIIAGVHSTHLARSFRKHFGCSVGEYLRHLRIEASCKELACTKRSISDIAVSFGFYDQAHFAKVFKKQTGVTPVVYRSQSF